MEINELLDQAKRTRRLPTDLALAAELGVSRSSVSNWRHQKNLPDPVQSEALAQMAGLPLNVVIGTIGEARAISAAEKAVWRRLGTMLIAGVLLAPAILSAGAGPTSQNHRTVPIMSAVKVRVRRTLLDLLRMVANAGPSQWLRPDARASALLA